MFCWRMLCRLTLLIRATIVLTRRLSAVLQQCATKSFAKETQCFQRWYAHEIGDVSTLVGLRTLFELMMMASSKETLEDLQSALRVPRVLTGIKHLS